MAGEIVPIVDLAGINDLQSRLAALETALGQYNAVSAVAAATSASAGTGSSTGTVNVITDTIKAGQTTSFNLSNTIGTYKTGTVTVQFGHTFATPPQVYATPKSISSGGTPASGPNALFLTIGNVTTTDFQVRVTNLFNANVAASVYWLARGQ